LVSVAAPTDRCRNGPALSAIALAESHGGSPSSRNMTMTFKDQHRPGDFNANAKLAVQAGLGALLACAVAAPAASARPI